MNSAKVSYSVKPIVYHFRCARGTGSLILSPVDCAFVDGLRNGGIPLEAVLRGINVTFEKWHRRPAQARIQKVNSITYCAQAITAEAQAMANAGIIPTSRKAAPPVPFPIDDVRAFLERNVGAVRKANLEEIAVALEATRSRDAAR